jgi:hypothetical protein
LAGRGENDGASPLPDLDRLHQLKDPEPFAHARSRNAKVFGELSFRGKALSGLELSDTDRAQELFDHAL